MGDDAGKWINRVSHQLKRQMCLPGSGSRAGRSHEHAEVDSAFYFVGDHERGSLPERHRAGVQGAQVHGDGGSSSSWRRKAYIYREAVKEDARLKRIVPTRRALELREPLLTNIRRREDLIRRGIPDDDHGGVRARAQAECRRTCPSWEEQKESEKSKEGKEEADEQETTEICAGV